MTTSRASLLVVALVVSGLTGCAPRAARTPNPPPASGPFRTLAGAPTHPECGPPKRPGAQGTAPRCVVSFGRSLTSMGTSPDGTLTVVSLMDTQPTTWRLPALTFAGELVPPPLEPGANPHEERESPQAIAVAGDARTALLAAGDEILRYDLASGRPVGAFEGPEGLGMVDHLVWSHDGRSLLIASAGDGKARILDATNGRVVRELAVPGRAAELAFDHDARRAAVGTETGTVAIFELAAKGAKPRVLTASTQEITGLAFVGNQLVTAARDGHVRIYDAASGKPLRDATTGFPITHFTVSADGLLGAASDDRHVLRIVALPGGVVRASLVWHQASITALAWAAGPTLLVADNDGELAAWEVPSGTSP